MSDRAGADSIQIGDFEAWMRPQVAALFAAQYGGTTTDQERVLELFYDHPFQQDRAIRLVALDGDTVVGFQSLFFWPYRMGERVFRSFQSGRSLVASTHRGRGIFGRLLDHLDQNRDRYGFDFLMGFPVEASYGSFIRNGWSNPFDVGWLVRPLHLLSILAPREVQSVASSFDEVPEPITAVRREGCFELAEDQEFLEWRRGFSSESAHSHFHYREGNECVRFDCKPNRRGRVNELIIGSVRRSTDDPGFLDRALRDLIAAARTNRSIALLSIASNAHCIGDPLPRILRRRRFFPIRKKIHFITKDFTGDPRIQDPSRWILYRADVDTW
ncbi:MAG: GNAT family N-acetyltransferase [bacterium]